MKRALLLALVLMLTAVAFPSTAQAGWIFGAGVGSNTVNIDEDFDESDLGWKAFAGYRFIKYFGVEAQYVEFGSPDNEDFEVDLSDLGIYGQGIIPIGEHFEITGKVGYHLWDIEVEDLNLDESGSDDDWDFSYGAGVAFVFGEHFGIRLEYEEFEVEDTDNVTMASASFEWRL
jgi:OOP family OmpA-OmpF porin